MNHRRKTRKSDQCKSRGRPLRNVLKERDWRHLEQQNRPEAPGLDGHGNGTRGANPSDQTQWNTELSTAFVKGRAVPNSIVGTLRHLKKGAQSVSMRPSGSSHPHVQNGHRAHHNAAGGGQTATCCVGPIARRSGLPNEKPEAVAS